MLTNSPWTRPTVLPGNYGGIATPRVFRRGGPNSGGDLIKSQGFGGSDSSLFTFDGFPQPRFVRQCAE